jgi:predicted dehydrogenase
LPHLSRNEKVKITAIVDSRSHPTSNLNPNLEPLESLASRYNCPVYQSLTVLLQDPIGKNMDGAIVCTPHSTHFAIGRELIDEGKRRYSADKLNYRPINVLMEKPMTTNVKEAKELHNLLMDRQVEGSMDVGGEMTEKPQELNVGGGVGCFLINHSANYRAQARAARSLIQSGKLGEIRHGKSIRCASFYQLKLSTHFQY